MQHPHALCPETGCRRRHRHGWLPSWKRGLLWQDNAVMPQSEWGGVMLERRDKRTENVPLKTVMVSSRGSGNTVLHQNPTAAATERKVHLLPWYLAQAAPFSCLSRPGREGGSLTICWFRLQLELEQPCARSRQPGLRDAAERHATWHESFSRPSRDANVTFHQGSPVLHHLHPWRRSSMEGLDEREKRRFGMQTDIYCIWETGVHFPHRIICNSSVLLETSLLHICPSWKPRLFFHNRTCGAPISFARRTICYMYPPFWYKTRLFFFCYSFKMLEKHTATLNTLFFM